MARGISFKIEIENLLTSYLISNMVIRLINIFSYFVQDDTVRDEEIGKKEKLFFSFAVISYNC